MSSYLNSIKKQFQYYKPEFDLIFVFSLNEFLFNLKSNYRRTNWLV